MPVGPGLAAGRLRRHVRLLAVAGLLPWLALRQGLRPLLPRHLLRRPLDATLMGGGVVLRRLPRLALRRVLLAVALLRTGWLLPRRLLLRLPRVIRLSRSWPFGIGVPPAGKARNVS